MKNAMTIKYIITAVIAGVVAVGIGWYMHFNSQHPATDDAYVKAHIIQIAPQVSGRVAAVYVHNHEMVQKGQLLFAIDATPYQIALQKAEAELHYTRSKVQAANDNRDVALSQVKQRQADVNLAVLDNQRMTTLYAKHYVAKQQLDDAHKQLLVAKAALAAAKQQYQEAKHEIGDNGKLNSQIQEAEAAVADAKLNLQYTKVYAPTNGVIAEFDLRAGDTVTQYQSPFSLIDNQSWWVDANFKETQLDKMRVGQPAMITIDMYPHHVFKGTVMAIAAGSGDSFSLMPTENASGNWVKVTQRFTVKVRIDNVNAHFPLRVGSSASVRVNP